MAVPNPRIEGVYGTTRMSVMYGIVEDNSNNELVEIEHIDRRVLLVYDAHVHTFRRVCLREPITLSIGPRRSERLCRSC
jgi:hypothetical protein